MKGIFYFSIIYIFFSINLALSFTLNPESKDIKTGGRDDHSFFKVKNSNLKKGNDALKRALKYIDKNKKDKADKYLEKALSYFVSANKETNENAEILNLLGFSYYLVGDSIMSEIYYLEGLNVDPENILINQRLGQLYLDAGRTDLANDRLKILKKCECKEYLQLKEASTKIKGSKN
tara:strand:+ start:389 stop:919 length:531 start_codon:yes stop_codon:yes gene_type:complete